MSGEDEVLAPGEASGGFFLVVPPAAPPDVAERLEPLLAVGGTVGVLMRGEAPGRDLGEVCRRHGVALFVTSPDLIGTVGATGVLLDDPDLVAATRRRFGRDMLIGVAAGVSRHKAMTGGEEDADFVAFGSLDRVPNERLTEALTWWSEVFVLPSLALARLENLDEVAPLRAAGADFVAVPIDLLLAGDDPVALVEHLEAEVGAT